MNLYYSEWMHTTPKREEEEENKEKQYQRSNKRNAFFLSKRIYVDQSTSKLVQTMANHRTEIDTLCHSQTDKAVKAKSSGFQKIR